MNRTVGIIVTIVTALCCGCLAIMSCIWGGLIASGQPIETTVNGATESQVLPMPVGIALICLSLIFIIIPVAVGFFTLRNKPAAADNLGEPLPPTS